ncbi:MAG: hypothetical protein K0Q51_1145 [Rickettsiaceae bacterium]|jgi:hypothetical protein|nr:hypothetical protein [Rickettsiaceae bacterium]
MVISTEEGHFIAYDRIDNWKMFSYSKRYLDALASVLLVYGNNNIVASIGRHEGKFFLSYNRTFTTRDKKIVNTIIQFINNAAWKDVLHYHLIYNQIDFQGRLSTYMKFLKNIPQEIEEEVNKYLNIIKSPTNADKFGKDEILKGYFGLLDLVKKTNYLLSNEFKQILLKPLQNVAKLCYFLKAQSISLNIEFLENSGIEKKENKTFHSDVNIIKNFPVLDETYVGVSRLCCAACHKTFETYKEHQEHRGTHGVCYIDWESPLRQFNATIENLKKEAENIDDKRLLTFKFVYKEKLENAKTELNKRYKLGQQNDLSDDEEIEKEITFDDGTSLWDLKGSLGMFYDEDKDEILNFPEQEKFTKQLLSLLLTKTTEEDLVSLVENEFASVKQKESVFSLAWSIGEAFLKSKHFAQAFAIFEAIDSSFKIEKKLYSKLLVKKGTCCLHLNKIPEASSCVEYLHNNGFKDEEDYLAELSQSINITGDIKYMLSITQENGLC